MVVDKTFVHTRPKNITKFSRVLSDHPVRRALQTAHRTAVARQDKAWLRIAFAPCIPYLVSLIDHAGEGSLHKGPLVSVPRRVSCTNLR